MKARLELPVFQKGIDNIQIAGTSISPTLKNGKWVFENIQGKIQITLKK